MGSRSEARAGIYSNPGGLSTKFLQSERADQTSQDSLFKESRPRGISHPEAANSPGVSARLNGTGLPGMFPNAALRARYAR